MKITVNYIGVSKISAIKIIRKYSGFSMKQANDFIDNLPNSFISKTPYEHLDEMFNEFENEDCKIEVETGYSKPNVPGTKRIDKIIFGTQSESQEKIVLKTKTDVSDFMTNRQDIKKGFAGGLVAAAGLLIMFGSFFYYNKSNISWENYSWIANILIGLTIGYSIRRRGKSVESKTGMFAAFLTLATAVIIRYAYDLVMLYKFGSIFDFYIELKNIYELKFALSLVLSALFAYSVSWDKLSSINSNFQRVKSENQENSFVSSQIELRKEQFKSSLLKKDVKK